MACMDIWKGNRIEDNNMKTTAIVILAIEFSGDVAPDIHHTDLPLKLNVEEALRKYDAAYHLAPLHLNAKCDNLAVLEIHWETE